MDKGRKTVSVIGVGYIGLPLTAALAHVGYNVYGVDINEKRVEELNKNGATDIYEPGLSETLTLNKKFIKYTTDYKEAIDNSEAIFITVGTPLKEDKTPNYSYIDSAMEKIGKYLKKGQLLILKSTVVLGTTLDYVKPQLEKITGMKAGKDFDLVFCPERTVEGMALHELYAIPKIIGGVSEQSTNHGVEIISRLGGKITKVSSPTVAEMCKLVDNTYRAANIAFANELGNICESLGINAHEVVSVVNNSYPRTNMFRPGLGADGPCLSKDAYILRTTAEKYGLTSDVLNGCITRNIDSTNRIADMAIEFISKNKISKPKISIIGLAFKGFPETDDPRDAPSIKIEKVLRNSLPNAEYSYYDPLVKNYMGKKILASMEEAVDGANVVMFLTNHPKIVHVDASHITGLMSKPGLIIDAWGNIRNPKDIKSIKGFSIFRIGDGELIKK